MNLECVVYPYGGNVAELEKGLIALARPPLNLAKFRDNPHRGYILERRKECREEARGKNLKRAGAKRRKASTKRARSGPSREQPEPSAS
jgi:hypothetical protein